jgi:hypothetical protein
MRVLEIITRVLIVIILFLSLSMPVLAEMLNKGKSQECDFNSLLLVIAEDKIHPIQDFANIGKVKVKLYNNSLFSISSFAISYNVNKLNQSNPIITKDYKLIDIIGGVEPGMSSVETIYIHNIQEKKFDKLNFEYNLVEIIDNKQKSIIRQDINYLDLSNKSPTFECIENTPTGITKPQILTEAKEHESDLVPVSASKPKSRPKKIKIINEVKAKPVLKPKEVVEAKQDATAKSILESLKEINEPKAFLGLTDEQKLSVGNIIRNKMKLCWNPPVGVENGLTNIMILGLKFDIDGKLVESPVNLTPNSGVGSLQAFEAARRAVIRCSPYNELDPEIYDGWKELNLKINPKSMGR